jgi:glycosyltransferase involved in cell wall biosynthesis
MQASIIVATYNRARMLGECLDALARQQGVPGGSWDIVIVDNNSADGTRDVVALGAASAPVPVHYVFEPRQGKSHALNAGIAQASGDILAFTDDDVLVPPEWLASIVRAMDAWAADILGGRILPKWEHVPPRWLETNRRFLGALAINDFDQPHVHSMPYGGPAQVWGANMACRRRVFDSVGGFDTTLGPVGALAYKHEDVELGTRALAAGMRVVYDPTVKVFHRVPASRMTWRYMCRWHWLFGESLSFQSGIRPGRRHLFGMPGWQCRTTARLLARWLGHWLRRTPDAEFLQLDLMEALGRLYGYRKLWLLERRRRPSPDARSMSGT